MNKEDIKFLQELSKNIKNQDNHFSALPIYFGLVQDEWEECGDTQNYEDFIYQNNADNEDIIEGFENLLNRLIEDGIINQEDRDKYEWYEELEEVLDKHDLSFREIPVRKITKDITNVLFLTEQEAKDHIKSNYYHYNQSVRPFCYHAWRSPT